MYHLRLFGSPVLERGDVALTGRPVQRHRLALLALLALTPGRRLSRDKLLGYLWPERDTANARNLLKVATHVLRSELGEDVLISENDELRLNDQLIEADTAAFEKAIAERDHELAVELYRGPLLDGFFLNDAPEFEDWVTHQRVHLANACAGALENLARGAEASRDWVAAANWWQKRAAQSPYDTRVVLQLMAALDAAGSRGVAIQHAAAHERLLREELGVDPPAEFATALASLHEPTPVTAPVVAPHAAVPAATSHAATVPADIPRKKWGRPRDRVIAVLAVLAFAAVAWAAWPRGADPDRSIVVLPFVNLSGNPDNEYFSDGLTEEVIARLSALEGLKVISRTSAMHYKETRKPLREIARELNVAHVLEGSVRETNGRVRITAQLIDAKVDEHVWAESYELQMHDSFRVQEQIAQAVARALDVKLKDRQAALLTRRGTDDPEAYELYRRARYFWMTRTADAHEQAAVHYQQALERDREYADAYAGLAHLYLTSYQLGYSQIPEAETYSRIKWAAERALALDDESAEAHAALSSVLWWQRNWPGAERELLRALELNPGDANTLSWYTLLLVGMGRVDEAAQQAQRAYDRDPFAIIVSLNYGWMCFITRDYECAIQRYRRTLEVNPSWAPTHMWLGRVLVHAGQVSAGIESLTKAQELAPRWAALSAYLANAQAAAGKPDEARQLLERAIAQRADGFSVATAHIALGEPDSAFAALQTVAWQWVHRGTVYDPALDPLRRDPRFQQMVRRIQREMGLR